VEVGGRAWAPWVELVLGVWMGLGELVWFLGISTR
jgi:hypothetical protein